MEEQKPPITRTELYDRKFHGDEHGYAKAEITAEGALEISGVDSGPVVENFFGDDDIEWWVTIPAEYKDSVLLHLLKDKFERDPSPTTFQKCLAERGVPCEKFLY